MKKNLVMTLIAGLSLTMICLWASCDDEQSSPDAEYHRGSCGQMIPFPPPDTDTTPVDTDTGDDDAGTGDGGPDDGGTGDAGQRGGGFVGQAAGSVCTDYYVDASKVPALREACVDPKAWAGTQCQGGYSGRCIIEIDGGREVVNYYSLTEAEVTAKSGECTNGGGTWQ